MDERSFDRLTRLLGGGATRRTGLRALLGAVVGLPAAGAIVPGSDAAADAAGKRARGGGKRRRDGRRPRQEGPCGDGRRKDNICTKDKQCCTGYCEKRTGKTNKDRKGRCRCIRAGEACKPSQTCCGNATCTNRICGPAKPVPPGPVCTAAGGSCATDAVCCEGLVCQGGVCGECAPDVCATGCEYATVAAAYAAASPGATIYIGPGEYITSVMIDKSITLVGCPGDPGAILIPDYPAGAVDSYYSVLYENAADTTLYAVTVRNLTIEGRDPTDTYAEYLLRSDQSASIDWTIQGCTLRNANAGMYAKSGNHVIEDSVIEGCSYGAYVDTYRTDPMSLVVKNTTVSGADSYGVYFSGWIPSLVTIEGCTFTDNPGTGLYFYGQDTDEMAINITNSTFTGNGEQGVYGGDPSFFLYHGVGTITGSTFSGNREGIYVYDAALTITDTQITGNQGKYGGGLYLNANTFAVSLTLEGTTSITSNTAAQNGGGIYSNADCCPVTVTGAGTRVSGNSPDQCFSDEAPGVVNCATWQP